MDNVLKPHQWVTNENDGIRQCRVCRLKVSIQRQLDRNALCPGSDDFEIAIRGLATKGKDGYSITLFAGSGLSMQMHLTDTPLADHVGPTYPKSFDEVKAIVQDGDSIIIWTKDKKVHIVSSARSSVTSAPCEPPPDAIMFED